MISCLKVQSASIAMWVQKMEGMLGGGVEGTLKTASGWGMMMYVVQRTKREFRDV